ncbi:MAG: NADH-quinone oxidoreductase subunit H, partial [Chloroflexi bacterium]|nr:NADH-quinone oxidoreductase subunit H [Chloroflexota bacterium]
TFVLVFVFMWIKGTLPRFRYDQLMQFAWKGMLPVALLNVGLTAVGMAVLQAIAPR